MASIQIKPAVVTATVQTVQTVQAVATVAQPGTPVRDHLVVKPKMYGDQFYYAPQRERMSAARQALEAEAQNPITAFFSWLFG